MDIIKDTDPINSLGAKFRAKQAKVQAAEDPKIEDKTDMIIESKEEEEEEKVAYLMPTNR